MSGPTNANVHSLDAIRDIRLALISFGERVDSALGDLRSKIDRTLAWLEQDRPLYWREQERRAYDGVASTRIAYETCRMRTVGGRHSECIEEKIAFQRAKVRLEYCQHKIQVVQRWMVEAGRQADEYRGRSGPLKRQIDDDLPNIVAMLGRMIDAIESYADLRSAESDGTPVSLGSADAESSPPSTAPSAAESSAASPEIPVGQGENPAQQTEQRRAAQ